MSIEELGNIEVSSVSKSPEPLRDAPAAIYVITRDDILRSGALTIPEMLRLAPNLQVSQINGMSYSISARGFNDGFPDKLLVLIDGRTVYTPFYAGVFWDVQEVPPDDIDRIEVISGPGGTLWGANAVNGVINIVTRKASETQGGIVTAGGGNHAQYGTVQYGGGIGGNLTYRVYGEQNYFRHDDTSNGTTARDAWRRPQGGFRFDWNQGGDLVTFQGDAYEGSEEQLATANVFISGHNLVTRWNHQLSSGSELQVQAFYDTTRRFVPSQGGDALNTYDIDVQHSFSLGSSNAFVWGGGVRVAQDQFSDIFTNVPALFFSPASRQMITLNIFAQDTISLTDSLKLIPGIKLEKDTYIAPEPLPSVRASWKITNSDLIWGAVSRAIRSPSREDRDLQETLGALTVLSGGDMQSEKLTAYEIGYRSQPTDRISYSISTYLNHYDELRSIELSPGGALPLTYSNMMEGNAYGVEIWGSYRVNDWWRLSPGVTVMHENLRFKPGSSGLGGLQAAGDDPTHTATLRSSIDIRPDLTWDADLREIGALPNPSVPNYTELNTRLGWNMTHSLQLSLSGFNLLHTKHVEFILPPTTTEIGRSFLVGGKWTF